jgi:ribosomal protein S18 acetylase RimI-like enzyme
MSEPIHVEAARGDELPAAFSLMYQHLPVAERYRSVTNALRLVEQGDITLEQVLIARRGEQIDGVVVFSPCAGAAGQVWPPRVIVGVDSDAREDALLRGALDRLKSHEVLFVQAMLAPGEDDLAPSLLRAGFVHLSSLLTLSHPLYVADDSSQGRDLDPPLTWQRFVDADAGLFQRTLLETYAATLDFPELNGLRDVSEIMQAHEKHGRCDPNYWFLVWRENRPLGVVLLIEMPEWNEWELSYVGVVPAERGKGIGRAMVQETIRIARRLATSQLTVSVDSRNVPAWQLYVNLGFRALDEFKVYLLLPNQ